MGNKMKEDFYKNLDCIKRDRCKFAIWGAGAMGKVALQFIDGYDSSLAPDFFVDNNPATWGKNNTISPMEFFETRMKDIDMIFICVYVADEVENQLRKCGYKGDTMPLVASVFYGDYYEKFFDDNIKHIEMLKRLLEDELSVKTLDVFYQVAKTGNVDLWNKINGNSLDKTLEQDILKLGCNESFVDVGAFIGDTVERFLEITNGKYSKIICFEPEPNNYKILKEYLSDKKNTLALKIAVSDENGMDKFIGSNSEGGRFDVDGNIMVEKKRLDDVLEVHDASFIKLSTLGFELPVLRGAGNIIKRNKPKLSYYCANAQLWEIPFFLKEIMPEYKIYIRHYGVGMQAMIGYATVE